jgi:hypothetical protein
MDYSMVGGRMPPTVEIEIEWNQYYAWWPTRSSWSKKRIWLTTYWRGEIFYDAMGRPPIKESSWKLTYTKNEYLLMLLKQGEKYNSHPIAFKSVRV